MQDPETTPETNAETSPKAQPEKNGSGNGHGLFPRIANLRRGPKPAPVHQPPSEAPQPTLGDPGKPSTSPGGLEEQLAYMRHVLSQPASQDGTPGEKACRKWLKANPAAFMAAKTDLEKLVARNAKDAGRRVPASPRRELCARCKRLGGGKPLRSCAPCMAWWNEDADNLNQPLTGNALCDRCRRLGGGHPIRSCKECLSWWPEGRRLCERCQRIGDGRPLRVCKTCNAWWDQSGSRSEPDTASESPVHDAQ